MTKSAPLIEAIFNFIVVNGGDIDRREFDVILAALEAAHLIEFDGSRIRLTKDVLTCLVRKAQKK